MKAKLIVKQPFMLRRGSFWAVFSGAKIPAAGGRPSHCPGYAVIAAFLPVFREHGLSFTEPEISRVFPVDERAGGARKARAAAIPAAGEGVRGHGGPPLDNEQKKGPAP